MALIIALGLLSAVWILASEAARFQGSPANDPTSEFVERFERIKEDLSLRGVVGYIGDDAKGVDEGAAEFALVQYALLPVIVVWETDRELVVGNFHDSAAGRGISESKGLTVLKDLGGGVMLLGGRAER
ncbi:MAG: hypothetical protein ACYSU0_18095 [Planctomycetota bacterium]